MSINSPYAVQPVQAVDQYSSAFKPQINQGYPIPNAPTAPVLEDKPIQTQPFNTLFPQNVSREQKFSDIINKHEISQFFADKLQLLNMFKIVFVFDDSGSMNTSLGDSPLNKGLMKATRWNELEYFANISIEIANIFNETGSDVYFLNRPMARNICAVEQLAPYFFNKPSGYTPISKVLNDVLSNNSGLGENKLLIVVVTDGEPTNNNGEPDIQTFKQKLKSRPLNTFTTIVSCTDEEKTMDYLNNWDKKIPRLDVVDDYRSERKEIQNSKGQNFRFSFGDYVVKSMVGSIDPKLDKFDEHAIANCCNIS